MEIKTIWYSNPNDFIREVITFWVKHNVSDIHVTPSESEVYIRFRIWGDLISLYSLPRALFNKFANAIKISSWMDMNKNNTTQDWKMLIFIEKWKEQVRVNVRVSTLPSLHWENIVMRILLADNNYLKIENLWYSEENEKKIREAVKLKDWLVLLCWWTWSWKTTTLYSLLNTFDIKKTAIFTLEDPVEYQIDGYTQTEIKNGKWLDEEDIFTFSEWLIWILRQDPDVIMIWEIRRKQEAYICLEAANTGHIVMWSIHSNNAISVITRLRQLGIESYLLAWGLKYIISQKLVKKLCSKCRKETTIEKYNLPLKFQKYANQWENKAYISNTLWCKSCINWYSWSVVVSEILENNDKFYEMLLLNESDINIKKELDSIWFIPFYIDAFNKSKKGLIDLDDALSLKY